MRDWTGPSPWSSPPFFSHANPLLQGFKFPPSLRLPSQFHPKELLSFFIPLLQIRPFDFAPVVVWQFNATERTSPVTCSKACKSANEPFQSRIHFEPQGPPARHLHIRSLRPAFFNCSNYYRPVLNPYIISYALQHLLFTRVPLSILGRVFQLARAPTPDPPVLE